MSAAEAARLVRDGDRIHLSVGPHDEIQEAIAARMAAGELRDIKLRLSAPSSDPGWLQGLPSEAAPYEMEFELFIGNIARSVTDERRGVYIPNLFSTAFKAQDENRVDRTNVDVAIIRVSPPDEHGFVYFGSRVWDNRSYARRARTVLAIVDAGLPPPIGGDAFLPITKIDAFVEGQSRLPPALVINEAEVPEEARRIAGYLKELIRDGDCIQIGVGTPSALMVKLGVFDDKKDLGVHLEVPPPGLATLVAAGVINGSRKTIHRGKAVSAMWPDTGPERDLVIGNPLFEAYEAEYVVNIRTVAQNKNQTAINNAIAVDLTGQINAESTFGGRMINGSGGQPELHIGAFLAEGGRAITLMYSTALGGARSRIVAQHDAGDMITIPRFFADIVITEYGVAQLLGKNHRQRAEALIAIAHPDHRAELRAAANKLFYPDSDPVSRV